MKKTILRPLIAAALILAPVCFAHAQKQTTIPRLGILRAGAPPDAYLELFLQGLRDLGYVEGKNIIIELRYAGGKQARASELAAELLRLKVDAIFTGGTRTIFAVKEATKTIPIVFGVVTYVGLLVMLRLLPQGDWPVLRDLGKDALARLGMGKPAADW